MLKMGVEKLNVIKSEKEWERRKRGKNQES
jgi:hypothetical protein